MSRILPILVPALSLLAGCEGLQMAAQDPAVREGVSQTINAATRGDTVGMIQGGAATVAALLTAWLGKRKIVDPIARRVRNSEPGKIFGPSTVEKAPGS